MAYINKISPFTESEVICLVHIHAEEKGPSQSNEASALGGLGSASCEIWVAVSRAQRGHEVDSGENPYEPQGPTADKVWGRRAWVAGD